MSDCSTCAASRGGPSCRRDQLQSSAALHVAIIDLLESRAIRPLTSAFLCLFFAAATNNVVSALQGRVGIAEVWPPVDLPSLKHPHQFILIIDSTGVLGKETLDDPEGLRLLLRGLCCLTVDEVADTELIGKMRNGLLGIAPQMLFPLNIVLGNLHRVPA